jgi:hypothetical protein
MEDISDATIWRIESFIAASLGIGMDPPTEVLDWVLLVLAARASVV